MAQLLPLQISKSTYAIFCSQKKIILQPIPERSKAFNDIIREVDLEQNVWLIDLDALLHPSSKYLFDTVHLNNEGSKLAGEIITEHILMILSRDFKTDLN